MKRLAFIIGIAAIAAFGTTGCKTTPGTDTIRLIGKAGGVTTGLVLNQCDIDAEAGAVITNIVANLGACQPKEGETLQDAWIRTAEDHTEILVARGKLTAQQAAMVIAGFKLVVKGYDLLIVKYPEVALYAELTSAAIDGFSSGLLATYKPGNKAVKVSCLSGKDVDLDMLQKLMETREFKMLKQ